MLEFKEAEGALHVWAMHYQRVIAAVAETIALQAKIDAAIAVWPME